MRFVAVGASLGGMRALAVLLGGLPKDFPAAIAVVQHRASEGTDDLTTVLQRDCALPIAEACDKQPIASGNVYVAPAGYHLLVDGDEFSLSIDPPVNHARPSVDVLFETAAQAFGDRTIAIVLSGASHDGARGALAVRNADGAVVVQDPATAESHIMPAATLALVKADAVLPVHDIATWLVGHAGIVGG
jgi:two-component system, chemotaxis family, protein-glutamate methylesterase/glutaminase